jgi:hypothetical protein
MLVLCLNDMDKFRARYEKSFLKCLWYRKATSDCLLLWPHSLCLHCPTCFLGYRYPSERLDGMGAGGVLGIGVACP